MILKLISNYVESFIDYWNETHSDKMSVGYSRTFNDKWRCKVIIGNQSYTSNPISQFDIPSFIDRTAETYVKTSINKKTSSQLEVFFILENNTFLHC